MSGEKDLEQLKREAAEKAKAAALAKKQAKQAGGEAPKPAAEPPKAEAPKAEDPADAKKAAAAAAKAAALAKKAAQETPAAEAPAGDDADLAKKKAAAAAKAKAAAAAKAKREGAEAPAEQPDQAAPAGDDAKAKAAAAAAAKAKAAAAAKAKATAQAKAGGTEAGDDEKAKAIAAAKAKAAAAAAAKAKAGGAAAGGDDEKAKAVAAAKAKAAAAAAARKKGGDQAAEAPAAPAEEVSPKQPFLDKYRKVIEENLGTDVLEDSYINKLSKHVPTLVAKRDTYYKLAQFLKYNELLSFDYLVELHGTDFETHMEIYAHFYSYKNRQTVDLKVKIDRDEPTIESLVPIWPGANWPECEAFDLLGIKFTGHPDLHRILLGEDWVGHPLRKDYKPHDVEV
ncbi:MAG: NADH-quinone oxidoreductase subunit C [Bacillota bacterium]|nr:NADH-quinone oxidoreductase subunit C [Bacillota bacterium]